ncbi:hypothetical protein HZH66_014701 [Vespula vulgaris]|uniref:Uncharacterized protein n=1 Tax=Vespula vulgaris TaxID=7454 RepID=A0A834IZV7_VESVU|nr:hypothetical protein HZH66_014701 [Vespula vulgaris]
MKIHHTVNSVVGYRTNVNLGSSANQCWKEEEEKSDGGDEEVEDGDEEHESTLVYKIEMILRDHVSLLQLTDKPAFQLVSAKKINQHVGLVNRQYHRKSKHGTISWKRQ